MRRLSTSFLLHFALASTLTIASSGCTTVQVTKVQEPKPTSWTFWLNPLNLWDELTDSGPAEPSTRAKGVRYFLPKPYLLVTPLPEGKIDVSVVYLPDPDQEYAVDTHVYIASQDFHLEFAGDVDAGKGLLSKVTYDPKDPTMLTNIVKSAGTMGQAIIDAKKAKKDAEEKQRIEALATLEELQNDVRDKQAIVDENIYLLGVEKLRLERFNTRNPDPLTPEKQTEKDSQVDNVATAQRKLDIANTNLTTAKEKVTSFKTNTPSTSSSTADTVPPNLSKTLNDSFLPGPTLFEIKENETSLTLQIVKSEGKNVTSDPVTGQMQLKTFMPVSNGAGGRGKQSSFRVSPPTISEAKGGYHSIDFEFSKPVALSSFTVHMKSVNTSIPRRKVKPEELSGEGSQKLTLKLSDSGLSGKWTIVILRDREEFEPHTIDFK